MKSSVEKIESSSTGDLSTIDMSIEKENMNFVFDLMFSQMYRAPISSVIREIVSNCFDSHIEAGVTDAVVVEVAKDEGGEYISFKDVGVGISPDRMAKIYSKPASSTKRDDPKLIGYFGLGSKSPLAYDDSFYLNTISDGVLYEYMVYKGADNVPKVTLLNQSATTEHNGSTVKIYFKNSSDKQQFEQNLTSELRYFDNVYVKGVRNFNNAYKIHVGEYFKVRSDYLHASELHICIGKVTYPINWKAIKRDPINVPFGLKFEVGDLPITPERESLRYIDIVKPDGSTTTVTEVINRRIEEMIGEIQRIYQQGVDIIYDDLKEWILNKDTKPYITFFGVNIAVNKLVIPRDRYYSKFYPYRHILDTPTDFFPHWYISREYYSGKLPELKHPPHVSTLTIDRFFHYLLVIEENPQPKYKPYLLEYLQLERQTRNLKGILFIRRGARPGLQYVWRTAKKGVADYEKGNKVAAIKFWKDTQLELIREKGIDLNTFKVPQDFIDEWKRRRNLLRPTLDIKQDEEIGVYDVRRVNPTNPQASKTILSLKGLKKFTGFVIYGFAKEVELLLNYATLFSTGKYMHSKACAVIQILVKDEKHLMTIPNAIHVNSFMSNHRIFKKVATAAIVHNHTVWETGFSGVVHGQRGVKIEEEEALLDLLFFPLYKKIKELATIMKTTVNLAPTHFNGRQGDQFAQFMKELLEVARETNLIDVQVEKDLNKVEKYFEGLDLLPYIVVYHKSLPHIANYFKMCGKPINKEWESLESWQYTLIEETLTKHAYLEDNVRIATTAIETHNAKYGNRTYSERKLEPGIILYQVNTKGYVEKTSSRVKHLEIFKNYHDKKAKNQLSQCR